MSPLFKTRRLNVQQLEERRLMAGNVSVSVSSGNLLIDGDDFNNIVQVVQVVQNGQPVAGSYRITGLTTAGNQATRINGGTAPITVAGVTGDVRIDLDNGNDGLQMGSTPLTVPRDLSIETDGGIDTLFLESVTVRDDLTINTGSGIDNLSLNRVTVGGQGIDNNENDASVSMGNDRDVFRVRSSSFARDLSANMGFGTAAETIDLSAASVGDDFSIITDDGADQVSLSNLTVADDLSVDLDNGNDTLILFSVAADDLTVALDGGADRFEMLSSNVVDDIVVRTGSENDIVRLDSVNVGDDMRVELGGGDDSLTVRNSSARDAIFAGELHSTATGDRRRLENNLFTTLSLTGFEGFL